MINFYLMDIYMARHLREYVKYCIDANAYLKIVEILQQCAEKKRFTLSLNTRTYTINVPKKLIEKYKDVLTCRNVVY